MPSQPPGAPPAPIDDLLVFHIVFGKTVPDISLNAVANLGYADGRFLRPVVPGDTLRATSEVIGVKENSNGKTGVVYVRTHGYNQEDQEVLSYVRWVMVNKKDHAKPAPEAVVPKLPAAVDPRDLPKRGSQSQRRKNGHHFRRPIGLSSLPRMKVLLRRAPIGTNCSP